MAADPSKGPVRNHMSKTVNGCVHVHKHDNGHVIVVVDVPRAGGRPSNKSEINLLSKRSKCCCLTGKAGGSPHGLVMTPGIYYLCFMHNVMQCCNDSGEASQLFVKDSYPTVDAGTLRR
jgi:hypothetical protein